MSEVDDLRARAARCRTFARAYASDIGASLGELADELDKKADRLAAAKLPKSTLESDKNREE